MSDFTITFILMLVGFLLCQTMIFAAGQYSMTHQDEIDCVCERV